MGSSPVAKLVYGYDLGGDNDDGWNFDEESVPWLVEDEDGDTSTAIEVKLLEMVGFTETDWKAEGYFERKREAEAKIGLELVHHGDFEYCNAYALSPTKTGYSVEWNEARALTSADLTVDPEWDTALYRAVDYLGLDLGTPEWLLLAQYG